MLGSGSHSVSTLDARSRPVYDVAMTHVIDHRSMQHKAARLLELHHASEPLVLANVWDVASARLVEAAGFPAVATTSSGIANAHGYPDGQRISRDEMLAAVRRISRSVDVPTTADMEAGYGPTLDDVAETVNGAIAAGAVGINLEDSDDEGLFPLKEAAARIETARTAAAKAGVNLVINARTDVYLLGARGREAFDEAVRRANAYRSAGADCLFVPGVTDGELIGELVKAITGPLNVLANAETPPVAALRKLGVKRISVGGALARASLTVVRRIAAELRASGTFTFASSIIPHAEMNALFVRPEAAH